MEFPEFEDIPTTIRKLADLLAILAKRYKHTDPELYEILDNACIALHRRAARLSMYDKIKDHDF